MNRRLVLSTLTVWLALAVSQASAQEAPDTAAPTAAPAPVVVALGDSVTAGFGLGPKDKFPAVLQRRLAAEGYPHHVVNAGRNGDSTSGALRRLERALVPDTEILIVALGGNDRRLGASADTVYKNLTQIIEQAQARGIKILLCDMNTGIEGMLARLAEKYHTGLVPSMMADVRADPGLRQSDGHPNAIGGRLIAEMIWSHLQPMLTKE